MKDKTNTLLYIPSPQLCITAHHLTAERTGASDAHEVLQTLFTSGMSDEARTVDVYHGEMESFPIFLLAIKRVGHVQVAVQEALLMHFEQKPHIGIEQSFRRMIRIFQQASHILVHTFSRHKITLSEQPPMLHFNTRHSLWCVNA